MPPRVQLAIQGGGARLCALLAAAEPFQRMHRDRRLEITRVAGTSAGAVVAAVLANDIPIQTIRTRLLAKGPDYWANLFPPVRWWQWPGVAFGSLVRRRPIYDLGELRSLLRLFFEPDATFESLRSKSGIEAIVVTASLLSPIPNRREGAAVVVDSLIDSCALPFIFRGAPRDNDNAYVDGGVVCNLPSEVLEPNQSDFGRVIGIGFQEKAYQAAIGPVRYAFRLFESSMDAATKRARKEIGPDLMLEVPTQLETFTFDRIHGCLTDEFDPIAGHSERWLRSRLHRLSNVDLWTKTPGAVLAELSDVCDINSGPDCIAFVSRTLRITANSLSDDPNRMELADEVVETIQFCAGERPAACLSIWISAPGARGINPDYSCSVKGPNGDDVPHRVLPGKGAANGEIRREALVFFTPALEAGSGPYTLRFGDHVADAMGPLRTGHSDTNNIEARLGKEFGPHDAEIVLLVPKGFDRLLMSQADGAVPGGIIPEGDLQVTEDGFKAYGWRGRLSLPGERLGVMYARC